MWLQYFSAGKSDIEVSWCTRAYTMNSLSRLLVNPIWFVSFCKIFEKKCQRFTKNTKKNDMKIVHWKVFLLWKYTRYHLIRSICNVQLMCHKCQSHLSFFWLWQEKGAKVVFSNRCFFLIAPLRSQCFLFLVIFDKCLMSSSWWIFSWGFINDYENTFSYK